MSVKTAIVMRSRNDMSLLAKTIDAVYRQTCPFDLIAFDNASTDGGREVLDRFAQCVLHVAEGCYVPGRVLNRGMSETSSEIVVFLNADCEPIDENWLGNLLAPFKDAHVGATFGRQLPRPGCLPLAALDTEATYGDGSRQSTWRHCFSMASCAVRRSVWAAIPFDESLAYSEDIAWSWKVRQSGFAIEYVPQSSVYHSHNYTNDQWRRRQYGEGKAEAAIFSWTSWQRTFFRYSLLPFARQTVRDLRYCASSGRWRGILNSPGYRYAQMMGRRRGFLAGLTETELSTQAMAMMEIL